MQQDEGPRAANGGPDSTAPATHPAPATQSEPSISLLGNLRTELMRYAPFSQMQPADVERLLGAAEQVYFAPGEIVLSPADGPARYLVCIRQGHVTGQRSPDEPPDGFEYEAGDLFPVGAALSARPVEATYRAQADVFCLLLPADAVRSLMEDSPSFASFLGRRALRHLDLSRKAMQIAYSSQALEEQSLETTLGQLNLRLPVAVTPDTPLSGALAAMHERHIGSVVVVDGAGATVGILTRHDILERVTLAQTSLAAPISQVMTAPVRTLTVRDTAQDAALLMTRHAIRHVPVTQDGRVVGLVSERDLFAMQRLSLKCLTTAIRAARDVDELAQIGRDIRRFARDLIGQGVAARQLTQLVSHLNDALTEHLVRMLARDHAVDLEHACWLAFDSEGRAEPTIITNQSNGLLFWSDAPERDRPLWLEFARRVNEALVRCGYLPNSGSVMAGNPYYCLTAEEWGRRFGDWMARGNADDLLQTAVCFDLRPLVGQADLIRPLRDLIARKAAGLPTFIERLALNSVRSRPPLNWLGSIETREVEGRPAIDLKLSGTAIFVDVARLYALAHGIPQTGTRERFEALGTLLNVPPDESQAWAAGFEYLQMLRLQVQIAHPQAAPERANMVDVGTLNDIDRRTLKETFRVAARLQQNVERGYLR